MRWFDKDIVARKDIQDGLPYVTSAMALVNGGTAIQAGGHVGYYTRFLSKVFDQVVVLEPVTPLFELLVENTMDLNNVKALQLALSDVVSKGKMTNKHPFNSGTSQLVAGNDVTVVTIDSLNLDNVTFILLDVEGHELKALQGAEKTILRDHPVIMVEDRGHGPSCDEYLTSIGYGVESVFPYDKVYKWR